MENNNAEDYWWYRLVKTLYILAVSAFLIVLGSAVFQENYGFPPKTDFQASTYGYECLYNDLSGGKFESETVTYDASLGTDQNFRINPFGSLPQMDQVVSKICFNEKIPETEEDWEYLFNQEDVDLSNPNHKIVITNELKDKTNKQFVQELTYVLAGFVLLILITVLLIPKVFNYIVFGKQKSPEASH